MAFFAVNYTVIVYILPNSLLFAKAIFEPFNELLHASQFFLLVKLFQMAIASTKRVRFLLLFFA